MKKEILPFVTTWIDFNGIMLGEVRQGKANTVRPFNMQNLKKKKSSYIQRTDWWLPKCEMGEKSQKVQTSSYKCHGDYS